MEIMLHGAWKWMLVCIYPVVLPLVKWEGQGRLFNFLQQDLSACEVNNKNIHFEK